LATPVAIFWLWLVISPARVAILCPEDCRCDACGYHVNCSSSSLKEIPLIHLSKIWTLLLANNNIHLLENDSFVSRGLTGLQKLQADFCQIETIQLGAFNGLTNLAYLSMRGNKISEIKPDTFQKMNCLRYLNLGRNRIEHLDVDVFSGLVNLEILVLAENKLQHIHPNTSVGLPKFQSLLLSNNFWLQTPNDSYFINSPFLKHLDISACNISSMSVETFANVSALERLNLRFNNLRSVDINILKALPNLSALYLYGNPLQCDCQLQEVLRWFRDHNIETEYKEITPECETQSELKGVYCGKLEKDQRLQGNIHYHGDCINTSCNYTIIENMDTDMDTLTDAVTELEHKECGSAFLKQYMAPVYAVLFIFGATGNIILIIIITCNKDMRTVPNVYILNLAISDLTYLTVNLFEVFANKLFVTRLDGEFMSSFFPFCHRLSVGLTVYSVAVLSVYRYRVTVNPFIVRVPSQPTWHSTVATVCGVWILAALFAVPSAFLKYLCYEPIILGHASYYLLVVIFELLVSCVIPLFVIAFSYIMMARHLVKMSCSMSEETQKRQVRALKNTAKVVLGLTVVFLISYVPYHTYKTYLFVTAHLKLSEVNFTKFNCSNYCNVGYTVIALRCLLLINSCLNPVALICMSFAFRRQFKHYLSCCCKTNSPSNDLELTRRN
jgi:hypothetical protein